MKAGSLFKQCISGQLGSTADQGAGTTDHGTDGNIHGQIFPLHIAGIGAYTFYNGQKSSNGSCVG